MSKNGIRKSPAFWRVALPYVALALAGLAVFLSIRHVSGPRIVGRVVAPDGTEMCIIQKCNWDAEPFTTRFVFRRPGGRWKSHYFDHEDNYWRSSQAFIDTNASRVIFYRAGGARGHIFLENRNVHAASVESH